MVKTPFVIPALFDQRRIEESANFVAARFPFPVNIALVLGSGLGGYADGLAERIALPAQQIPFYPLTSVQGHKGELVFGKIREKRVLAFQGRIHLYECNNLALVLYPVMLGAMLGARTLIVSNAAGGVNRQLRPGDLMLITDQIDLTLHPMRGISIEGKGGPLFDPELAAKAKDLAREKGLSLRCGVYAGVKGPSYETGAEVEMVRRLGGDAVGMSTVKEVTLASELGMRVLGISCITNKATGIGLSKLVHEEVTEVANRVKRDFACLLNELIVAL